MYEVALSTIRDAIDVYTGDSGNTIWSEAQKNLAINMAIKSAWPAIYKKNRTSFTLSESSYVYFVNGTYAITTATRAPNGPAQIWVSTTAASGTSYLLYRQLRRSVNVRVDGAAWALEFEKEFVDNRDGYKIEVHFEQMYPGLSADAETTEVPEDYVIPRAMFELCGIQALTGHHTDVQVFRQERPNYYEQAEDAKRRHMRLALPRSIGVRWE